MLPAAKIPLWAAYWIAAGCDGEGLVYLAGLHGDNPHDVRDALPAALADCGTVMPDSDAAAAAVMFVQLARMHLDGLAGALWVAQKAEDVLGRADFSDSVMALPLARLYDIADEWDGGWGRTREQLAEVVRAACEKQLAIASLSGSPADAPGLRLRKATRFAGVLVRALAKINWPRASACRPVGR